MRTPQPNRQSVDQAGSDVPATEVGDRITTDVGSEILLENARFRLWRVQLEPGESTPLHRHVHDYAFVYANPSLMEATVQGSEETIAQPSDEGFAYYREVGRGGIEPHRLTNVGQETSIHYLIEFLDLRRSITPGPPTHNGRVIEGLETDW